LLATSSARLATTTLAAAVAKGEEEVERTRKDRWEVVEHAVLDNWVDGDRTGWKGRTSDHRAVVVELVRL